MTELKGKIKSFLEEQNDVALRLKALDKDVDSMDNLIKSHIKKAWKSSNHTCELDVLSGLQAGCHCSNYKIDVRIEIPIHVLCEHDKWMKIDYGTDFSLRHIPVDPPVDMKVFRSFASQMTQELGITVKVSQKRMPTQKQRKKEIEEYGVHNFDDLGIYCDESLELIESGNVCYKGWDICDPFLICRKKSSGKLVIAYATSGHSSNLDIILDDPTEGELSEFFDHVEQDSDNAHIRGKCFLG